MLCNGKTLMGDKCGRKCHGKYCYQHKKDRPSPSESATKFHVGERKKGNDENIWEIVKDKRGVQRWKKVSERNTDGFESLLKKVLTEELFLKGYDFRNGYPKGCLSKLEEKLVLELINHWFKMNKHWLKINHFLKNINELYEMEFYGDEIMEMLTEFYVDIAEDKNGIFVEVNFAPGENTSGFSGYYNKREKKMKIVFKNGDDSLVSKYPKYNQIIKEYENARKDLLFRRKSGPISKLKTRKCQSHGLS